MCIVHEQNLLRKDSLEFLKELTCFHIRATLKGNLGSSQVQVKSIIDNFVRFLYENNL